MSALDAIADWPVTATTSWAVTWTSNIGIAGELALTGTASRPVSVIEWAI